MAIENSDAAFDPGVAPVNAPEYFGYSHSITQPKFVSQEGIAIEAAGNVIEQSVKAADTLESTIAQNEARDRLRPEKDAYMNTLEIRKRLEQQRAGTTALPADRANPYGIPQDVFDANASANENVPMPIPRPADADEDRTLPPEARSAIGQMEVFKGARANGSISQTDYWARTSAITKDIRSKYGAAYWPVIDKEVGNVLGTDPANAYIRSVIGDINSYVKAANSPDKERQHIVDAARKSAVEGNPEAVGIYNAVRNGGDLGIALGKLQSINADKAAYDKRKTTIENRNLIKGYTQDDAQERVELDASYQQTSFLRSAFDGLEVAGGTPQSLDEEAKDAVKAQNRNSSIQAAIDKATNWINDRMYKVETPGTPSMGAIMGDERANKTRDAFLKPLRDIQTAYNNGQYGNALRIKRSVEAVRENADWQLMTNPTVGRLVQESGAWQRQGGQWAQKAWEYATKEGATNAIATYSTQMRSMMMTPYDPNNPQSPTFKDALNMSSADKQPPLTRQLVLQSLSDQGGVLDPKIAPQEAKAIIDRLTSPRNLGFISSLNNDDDGKRKGQMFYWKQSTSQALIQKAAELDKLYPGTLNNTKNWVEQTFGKELFNKDIKNLNSLQNQPNMEISWNGDNNSVRLVVKQGDRILDADASGSSKQYYTNGSAVVEPNALMQARRTVERINNGLGGIRNLATVLKQRDPSYDVTDYMIKTMQSFGFDPVAGESGVRGMPQEMLKNLLASKKKQQQIMEDAQ